MSNDPIRGLDDAEEVLGYWFSTSEPSTWADDATRARWFGVGAAFDAELRARFSELHQRALDGECRDWAGSARGRLALIIVLDQFTRNLYRGQAAMYQADARALELANGAVELQLDDQLPFDMRAFAYMPLMHAEDISAQERCVSLFEAWRAQSPDSAPIAVYLDFARQHRDIVARFGRFPHRNEILGRESTPEERAFLQTEGSSF